MKVSVVIPAYNEEKHIKTTLHALRQTDWVSEIVGVNDGSSDSTGRIMEKYCDTSISFIKNHGKTAAAKAGWLASKGEYIVILDADLKESAAFGHYLLSPLFQKKADLVIGSVEGIGQNGFGLVKRRVQRLIEKKSGLLLRTPLSGQRAFPRNHISYYENLQADGYGLETMMTLQAINQGLRITEVEAPFKHIGKGWGIEGICHRGRQWLEVERCLWKYGKSYS
ncbi:glycosyltransferase family 2 protein [Alteribacillus iranensis]|uniref:Glycosyltransferase involved in cell wall bisynthesis n=1 Tax=Alteribacillus iranensis TaxID=930128 RepID=A0A1I1ZMC8_9BACI|nr:glycosyltransferase family 2 protein [Alteribacillus iranensis]SFE31490.1 Glycosyltransferase involved in cell wall bisynthesis [Alteribacillus iranensis]